MTRAISDQLLGETESRTLARLVGTHALGDGLDVRGGDDGLLAEATNALGRLLGQDVALERLGAHDLARAGAAEALGRTLVRLHLGHASSPSPW